MRLVAYLSQVTFDRLFAQWLKKGFLMRDEKRELWVRPERLADGQRWIRAAAAGLETANVVACLL